MRQDPTSPTFGRASEMVVTAPPQNRGGDTRGTAKTSILLVLLNTNTNGHTQESDIESGSRARLRMMDGEPEEYQTFSCRTSDPDSTTLCRLCLPINRITRETKNDSHYAQLYEYSTLNMWHVPHKIKTQT